MAPIGEIDILSKLFSQVILPQAVIAELLHEDAPKPVRDWATEPPPWVSILDSLVGSTAGMEKLQAGEKAAILLAESIHEDVIVLHEKSERHVAAERGLPMTGTLGILSAATARRLVRPAKAIDRNAKNFRYSPALLKATLDGFRGRLELRWFRLFAVEAIIAANGSVNSGERLG